jgi:hypothetical protein
LGYSAVNRQNPIILNPDRQLDVNGITMVMFCGEEGSGREVLDKVTPDGDFRPVDAELVTNF